MKNKLLLLLLVLPLFLVGCASSTSKELDAVQFDMQFVELNQEEQTATFQITGYPSSTEFEQVEAVIIDSMSGQDVDGAYTVNVYSDMQETTEDQAFYGNCTYENGKITDNNLDLRTEDEYLAQ